MNISSYYQSGKPTVSFEIFPPKGDLGVETLCSVLDELRGLEPSFISVTCSAGGSGNGNGG